MSEWGRRSWEKSKQKRNGQIDRRTDRSFNDMRWNTEQYSKPDSIESNRIESSEIEIKWIRIELNGQEISRRDKIKEHEIWYDMIW